MMFNGELMRRATSIENGSFLWKLAQDPQLRPQQRVERLFLSALARRPTRDELRMADMIYDSHLQRPDKGSNAARVALSALQDLWWAVLNSNEFILNR
jgi:hypothetical protein